MNKPIYVKYTIYTLLVVVLLFFNKVTASQDNSLTADELKKQRELLKQLKTEADKEEIDITIKSVEISNFPEMKLIIEAYNKLGESLDTLHPEQIRIYEKGIEFKVEKVEKIPISNEMP